MGDNGLTSIVQFALSKNPELYESNTSNSTLGGLLFGLGKAKDPNRRQLASSAPHTLDLLDDDIPNVIQGQMSQQSMTPSFQDIPSSKDLSIDRSSLGNFGEVNTNSETPKKSFWNTKGGNITSSLLGVLGLGLLGTGIGAISGGRRGAAQGAAYGMGLGTLQDLGLRKSGAEANKNLADLVLAQQKISMEAEDPTIRYAKAFQALDPTQAGKPLTQDMVQNAMKAKNPYGEANLLLRAAGIELGADSKLNKQVSDYQKSIEIPMKTLSNFDLLNKQLGFDISTYDKTTNTANFTDQKGNTVKRKVDAPGYLGGKFLGIPFSDERARATAIEATKQSIIALPVHELFGATRTAGEMQTIQEMFQQNKFSTEQDMLDAMKNFKLLLNQEISRKKAGYSPKVQQKYQENLSGTTGAQTQVPTAEGGLTPEQIEARRILTEKGIPWE